MLIPILGLIIGVVIGIYIPYEIPYTYSAYIAIGILACMDAIFYGYKLSLQNIFNLSSFAASFLGDIALAIFITYLGTRLNIAFDLVAIIVFGTRIFQNLSYIRKLLYEQ